jgi:pimeloyl-ACP methyl ester carboxylesterase
MIWQLIHVLFFVSPLAFSQLEVGEFKTLESPTFQFIESEQTKVQYPWYARWIQSDFFKNQPQPNKKNWPEVCVEPQLKSLQDLKCQNELKTGVEDIFRNTWGVMNIKLNPAHHPFAKHVMIQLTGGIRLKGLLGWKGDLQKRPLLILRLGIFSNTEEFYPERFLFMQLFEESPFNVLLLESLTGNEFSLRNRVMAVGGVDEGLQNFWVAQKIQDPAEPISKIVQSVHLVGMSLGGHGVFYAALLNEEVSRKPIASFLNFCPLLNLKETLEYHQSNRWSYWLMNQWANVRLSHLLELYPHLSPNNLIFDFLTSVNKSSYQPLMPSLAIFREGKKDFYGQNDFASELSKVKTPFYVVATKKDPIVPYHLNSEKLKSFPNIQLVELESGYHCSLSVAYDWYLMSKVYQQHFFRMSSASGDVLAADKSWQKSGYPVRSSNPSAGLESLIKRWQEQQQ